LKEKNQNQNQKSTFGVVNAKGIEKQIE